MNNYELAAKIAKYAAIVATVYFMSNFGFSVNFNKDNK